jgi:hypothetical protein
MLPGSWRARAALSTILVALSVSGVLFVPIAADARPIDTLIVGGRSMGSLSLREARTTVEATAGGGKTIQSAAGVQVEFYRHLSLVVSYRSGRVAAVSATDLVYGWTPRTILYHTKSDVRVGASFNKFAAHYPHRRCRSATYMGGANGTTPFDVHQCIVIAAHGNFTWFEFNGPASQEPDCDTIGVGLKSGLAAEESAPLR